MRLRLGLSLAVALLVNACAGGQNDAFKGSGANPGGGGALAITVGNGNEAARVAYDAARGTIDSGGFVGNGGLVAPPPPGIPKLRVPQPQYNDPMSIALQVGMRKVPLGPFVNTCLSGNGTVTISGDVANPLGGLSSGDTINVDYLDCDDDLGEILNGRIEMTVDLFSGDILTGSYLLRMDVLLIDFQVDTASDSVNTNGDATVAINAQGLPMIEMSVFGTSVQTVSNAGTDTLANYATLQTVDTSVQPEPYTLAAGGRVTSSQLNGEVLYDTPVTFQGMAGSYPFAGEFLVLGQGDGAVRLIALDDVNIRIEIDVGNDGSIESTVDTTWVDFLADQQMN